MSSKLELYQQAISLLQQLIATPSFSKEEDKTADIITIYLEKSGVKTNRYLNNIWAVNKYFDASKPTILLNSHHDTVKPNKEYTRDPFEAAIVDDKLFGLGSNDAGGCLVSLIACFLYYYEEQNLKYNLLLAATAEEEISGKNGVEILLPILPPIDFAIVGEPTQLNLAIAERGLLVMDAMVKGSAGHAARNEGDNAIYKAIQDIHWIQQYQFDRVSDFLGPVKITVTSFYTDNKQHNVVPASAEYLLDIRVNELYTFEEVITILQHSLQATLTPRSTRLKSTSIPIQHPIVQSGIALGKTCYGSPTTSDKALMPFPALKMGPGDSARSHTADEFIFVQEIENGIDTYIHLLKPLV
ncbi:MAG: M20 family metallo-hydrolase [Sediminibacterium sp.]|jgi:acetylornithine deacetylase|nr:M20 family metallo-hydrolase [Chitinophagaceae bacterium]MCA6447538.1 M20 family metallo-hydrolase [Chitinophagaceae bacterium]